MSLKVVSYKKEKALTLPISSVFQDKNKPEVDYVYVLSKKNKPIKKIIEKGKISESIVEILKGLTQKTKVLKISLHIDLRNFIFRILISLIFDD